MHSEAADRSQVECGGSSVRHTRSDLASFGRSARRTIVQAEWHTVVWGWNQRNGPTRLGLSVNDATLQPLESLVSANAYRIPGAAGVFLGALAPQKIVLARTVVFNDVTRAASGLCSGAR